MSEATKNKHQVRENSKLNLANTNTIIERNPVASPMQAKEEAKAVVISAKDQKVTVNTQVKQEPVKDVKPVTQKVEAKSPVSASSVEEDSSVKAQDAKTDVSEPSKVSPVPNKVAQNSVQKVEVPVPPKTTPTSQVKPQSSAAQSTQAPKSQVSAQNIAKPVANQPKPAQKNVIVEKPTANFQAVNNTQTQKATGPSQTREKAQGVSTTSNSAPATKTPSTTQAKPTNQALTKPVPENLQQGPKTVVANNQTTTTNTSNNANQANKEQPVQGKPLATPVQAASPAVVKTVEEEQKTNQSEEEHKDIFKDLFVKLKSVWQNLNVGVKRYLALVLIPSLVCLGYFGLWASPMYISEVKFAVKSAEGGTSGFNLMTTLFRVPTASLQDAMVVEEFLRSNDAFYATDKQLDLIKHYTDQSYDLISRLSFAPTIDDIASFWNNVTNINVNQDSNVITFEVRAYSPEMAKNINEEILHISEDLVNSMNERAKEDMLQLADLEVAEARDRLTVAQDALRDFRNKNQDLDLKATAEGMQSLVIGLESQAALLRTQIAEQSRYTDQDAPALKALRDRLVGVEEQIERERSRLTEVSAQGTSLNTLASQYENLVTEAEFARQRLLFAMNSLESAKADILAKNLYIVTVAKPSLPDESLYPKPYLFTFYIFVALSMAYGVISLIVAAIKEHMGY